MAVYAGQGNQPFSAAQLALLEEERQKQLAIAQAKAQANQTPILQKDVGFWEGLSIPGIKQGRTSLEEQYNLAGNMYPREKTPWGQVPFTEHLNKLPGVQIGQTAEEWAEQRVNQDAQDRATVQRNLFHRIEDQNPVAGYNPTTSYTHIPEEEGFIKSGWNDFIKYYKNLDNPAKGVCTLSSGTKTQQLDRTACDAAGGSFDSPQLIKDRVLQEGGFFNKGIPGAINIAFKQLGHIRDTINEAQINDNIMQEAGFNWTPDKIAWIEKYGIRNLPGQLRDDTGGDTKATAVGRDTTGYVQEGLLSPSQLEDRYPKRYEDNAAANKDIFDAATRAAEGRDVTGVTGILPPSFMASEKERIAALQQGTDARFDRRMGDDRMAAASVWADRAIDEQEASIWADKAIDAEEQRIAGDWANQQIDKQERMAAIQAGIDADAGRTTQENYELAAGIDRDKMTSDSLLDGVTEAMESNEEWAKEKAETIQGWIAGAKEGIITWGSILVDKILGLGDNDNDGLEQDEVEVIINAKDELVPPKDKDKDVIIKEGLLNDSATITPDGIFSDGVAGSAAGTSVDIPSIFTTTSDSTEGFTMDRLKNPLSPENKKWWLGGGGGVPGNNRAVEFFNALAYIGTPLKYRPAKTPSESLQDRKIQHMNNMMDYSASVASSAASANQNTFTKLKAAVPSQEAIAKSIEGEFYGVKGFFEKGSETDRKIQARAGEIREKMLQMASEGIYPTKQKVYDNEEAERKRIEAEQKRKEEEEKRKNPEPAKSTSWWSNIPGIS